MNKYKTTREIEIDKLNKYRGYENLLLHKYGVDWKRELSIEEETKLEQLKNNINWKGLKIAK